MQLTRNIFSSTRTKSSVNGQTNLRSQSNYTSLGHEDNEATKVSFNLLKLIFAFKALQVCLSVAIYRVTCYSVSPFKLYSIYCSWFQYKMWNNTILLFCNTFHRPINSRYLFMHGTTISLQCQISTRQISLSIYQSKCVKIL